MGGILGIMQIIECQKYRKMALMHSVFPYCLLVGVIIIINMTRKAVALLFGQAMNEKFLVLLIMNMLLSPIIFAMNTMILKVFGKILEYLFVV